MYEAEKRVSSLAVRLISWCVVPAIGPYSNRILDKEFTFVTSKEKGNRPSEPLQACNLKEKSVSEGYAQRSNKIVSIKELLIDTERIEYIQSYLTSLTMAMRKGANVRGYFIWSVIDNFEWLHGYTMRYGLYHVNYDTQERTPKLSARWYKEFLGGPNIYQKIYKIIVM